MKILINTLKFIFVIPATYFSLWGLNFCIALSLVWYADMGGLARWLFGGVIYTVSSLLGIGVIGLLSWLFMVGSINATIIAVMALVNGINWMYLCWDSSHIFSSLEIMLPLLIATGIACSIPYQVSGIFKDKYR